MVGRSLSTDESVREREKQQWQTQLQNAQQQRSTLEGQLQQPKLELATSYRQVQQALIGNTRRFFVGTCCWCKQAVSVGSTSSGATAQLPSSSPQAYCTAACATSASVQVRFHIIRNARI